MTEPELSEAASLRWNEPLAVELTAAVQRGDAERLRRLTFYKSRSNSLFSGLQKNGIVPEPHAVLYPTVYLYGRPDTVLRLAS